MAKLPASIPDLVAQFGPHLNREPAGGWTTRGEPDRIVATHCCFCGQQCGIQLKVKDEKIVGFEPWEQFPFNRGKLCPKGVKRYMQDEHPDRLLTPLARDEARGFQPIEHRPVVRVKTQHAGVLVADQEFDHPVLPGLQPGGLPERTAELRVFAWRHGAKHVPGRIELLQNPGYPRQRLERRLQIVRGDQRAGDGQLVNRQFHPEFGGLVLDDEQRLVMGGREQCLRVQDLVELEIVRIGHGRATCRVRRVA